MVKPKEKEKNAVSRNQLLDRLKNNSFQSVPDVFSFKSSSLTEREDELSRGFQKYQKDKDGASVLERTKRDRKNSLLKPSSHLFCCMQKKWHTNYLCPNEEELEQLSCLSLGIKSIKYYKEWSSEDLSSELEKVFQELSTCEGYCLCMKSGKYLKLVQSTVPDCKSLKGIFPKMIYIIPMQSNLIGRPDPNVKISTIQCKECGKHVNRVHFLTHLADLCYDETPLKDGITYGRAVVIDETKSVSPTIDGNEIGNGDGEVELVTPKTNLRRHGSQLSLPTSDTDNVSASHVEEALVTKRSDSPEGKNNHHSENNRAPSVKSTSEHESSPRYRRGSRRRSYSRHHSRRSRSSHRSRSPYRSRSHYRSRSNRRSRSPYRSRTRYRSRPRSRSRSPYGNRAGYRSRSRSRSRSPYGNRAGYRSRSRSRSRSPYGNRAGYRSRSRCRSRSPYGNGTRYRSRSPSKSRSRYDRHSRRRSRSPYRSRSAYRSRSPYGSPFLYGKRSLHRRSRSRCERSPSSRNKNNNGFGNIVSLSPKVHPESQKTPEKKQSTDCIIEEYIAEREYPSLEEVQSYLTVSNGEIVTEIVFQDINKTLSPTTGNVTVNGRDKCTDPITPLPLPILTENCSSPELEKFLDIQDTKLKDAFAEEQEESMDPKKFEFVVNMLLKRITSLPCLMHLESLSRRKSPTIDAFNKNDLVETTLGIVSESSNFRAHYQKVIVFVESKLDVIFEDNKPKRKFILSVLVPECFNFAIMDMLSIDYFLANQIRKKGLSVKQVNDLYDQFNVK